MTDENTDAGLLLASAKGDAAAFRELYDRWADVVLAYFYRRTFEVHNSADLTAEVFAIAWERRKSFRDRGRPGAAWLFGIAKNELSRYHRKQRTELRAVRRLGVQVPAVDDSSIEQIERLIDMDAYRSKLETALESLSDREREAVRLRVVEELDYRSVAQSLGCSEGAARVRVHRGLATLADLLEAQA